jgi:hypothetical protein
MKLSILCPDNMVIVDGVALAVDCSHLPSYMRVIQWDGESGWIEFEKDARGQFVPNTKIVDIVPYQFLIDGWKAAKDGAERLAAERKAEAERIRKHNEEIAAATKTKVPSKQRLPKRQ